MSSPVRSKWANLNKVVFFSFLSRSGKILFWISAAEKYLTLCSGCLREEKVHWFFFLIVVKEQKFLSGALESRSELLDRLCVTVPQTTAVTWALSALRLFDCVSEGCAFHFPPPARPRSHASVGLIFVHNVSAKASAAAEQQWQSGVLCRQCLQLLPHTHRPAHGGRQQKDSNAGRHRGYFASGKKTGMAAVLSRAFTFA